LQGSQDRVFLSKRDAAKRRAVMDDSRLLGDINRDFAKSAGKRSMLCGRAAPELDLLSHQTITP
jgi:hypothetical protein